MKSLQLDKPHAIVVIGIQGSGKTFFAEKFAETFGAPFVNQSAIEMLSKDRASSVKLLENVTDQLLKTGRSIIIEQALSNKIDRLELMKRLKKAGYAVMFVWVQVDADAAIMRTQKSLRISENEYRANHAKFNPPSPVEQALVISGKHTFATQAKAVLRKLSLPRTTQQNPPRPVSTRGQIIVR